MPTLTPLYEIPYEALTDRPNGPLLSQDIATAVERELGEVWAAITPLASAPRVPVAPASTTSAGTASSSTTETRDAVLGNYQFTALGGTRYRVMCTGGVSVSAGGTLAEINVRDGGASTPTAASTLVGRTQLNMATGGGTGQQGFVIAQLTTFSAGTHTLSLFVQRSNGSGDVTPIAFSVARQLYVENCGST